MQTKTATLITSIEHSKGLTFFSHHSTNELGLRRLEAGQCYVKRIIWFVHRIWRGMYGGFGGFLLTVSRQNTKTYRGKALC